MRPRQWSKNVLVVAAAGAAGALGHGGVPVRVGLACVGFCLLASGIYAVNDVHDVHEDRLHPRKRHRPVASGALSPRAALLLALGLLLGGIALCALVRPLLVLVACGYVGLSLSYTLVWRRLVVLDLVAIAGGFVLRALGGGVAASVALSRWFVLVVTAAALMVAAGKRHAELRRSDTNRTSRRRVLDCYTQGVLRGLLVVSAAAALVAYCVWAFKVPTVGGVPWRSLTLAPFALCTARYCLLVRSGAGESPETLLLSDRWLALAGTAWLVLFTLSVAAR